MLFRPELLGVTLTGFSAASSGAARSFFVSFGLGVFFPDGLLDVSRARFSHMRVGALPDLLFDMGSLKKETEKKKLKLET